LRIVSQRKGAITYSLF